MIAADDTLRSYPHDTPWPWPMCGNRGFVEQWRLTLVHSFLFGIARSLVGFLHGHGITAGARACPNLNCLYLVESDGCSVVCYNSSEL